MREVARDALLGELEDPLLGAVDEVMPIERVARAIGNYPWRACLAFPITLLFFQAVFIAGAVLGALGRSPAWKSRAVTAR